MGEEKAGKVAALESLLQRVFYGLALHIDRELERELAGMDSILDVGCGPSTSVPSSAKGKFVGMDSFLPYLQTNRARVPRIDYALGDAASLPFKPKSFDCALALSVIEHLPKATGIRLLEELETVSRKKAILITPNGFLPQGPYEGNTAQAHVSGWEVEEFEALGYEVRGVGGLAGLKGERGVCRFRPRMFWRILSGATQALVRERPDKAFELLCVKRFSPSS